MQFREADSSMSHPHRLGFPPFFFDGGEAFKHQGTLIKMSTKNDSPSKKRHVVFAS